MALELEEIRGLRENKALKDTTRRQVLEYLKRHGRGTVEEIAAAAGITSMGVRRHLLTLENAGLVKMELERRPMGRPTHVYALTESADALFPQNYHHLTLQILDSLVGLDGMDKVTQLFERRKEKMLAAYAGRMQGKDLAGRVTAMAQIMGENGYMAECKKIDGGYAIIEHHCAIARVAQSYSQPCVCELDFIQKLLGPNVEVTRESHIASGDTCCAYVVRERPAVSIKTRRRKKRG
ncbi:MAG: transcriptional regulator [Acidobacteria bacterium]|nr:transcriptional regulator [Acidobacteriota bacterium]